MQLPVSVRSKSLSVSIILLVFLSVVFTVKAKAQESTMRGIFTLNSAASNSVDKAIAAATSNLGTDAQKQERKRLKRLNPVYHRVIINSTNSDVSITFDTRRPIESPVDGKSIQWTAEDGTRYVVTTTWENGRLLQSFTNGKFSRKNTFSISADGRTLTLHVTTSDARPSGPLTYNLVFNRAS